MRSIVELLDVVDWRLCLGCRACALNSPDRRMYLLDFKADRHPADGVG